MHELMASHMGGFEVQVISAADAERPDWMRAVESFATELDADTLAYVFMQGAMTSTSEGPALQLPELVRLKEVGAEASELNALKPFTLATSKVRIRPLHWKEPRESTETKLEAEVESGFTYRQAPPPQLSISVLLRAIGMARQGIMVIDGFPLSCASDDIEGRADATMPWLLETQWLAQVGAMTRQPSVSLVEAAHGERSCTSIRNDTWQWYAPSTTPSRVASTAMPAAMTAWLGASPQLDDFLKFIDPQDTGPRLPLWSSKGIPGFLAAKDALPANGLNQGKASNTETSAESSQSHHLLSHLGALCNSSPKPGTRSRRYRYDEDFNWYSSNADVLSSRTWSWLRCHEERSLQAHGMWARGAGDPAIAREAVESDVRLGAWHLEQRSFAAAEVHYKRAKEYINRVPRRLSRDDEGMVVDAVFGHANSLLALGRAAEARSSLESAMVLDIRSSELYRHLSLAANEMGDVAASAEYLELAEKWSIDHARTRIGAAPPFRSDRSFAPSLHALLKNTPLPQPSARFILENMAPHFAGLTHLGDVADLVGQALKDAGFNGRSYYTLGATSQDTKAKASLNNLPSGFAVVTQLERVDARGCPHPDRFKLDIQASEVVSPKTLVERLRSLALGPDPAWFRLIVFSVANFDIERDPKWRIVGTKRSTLSAEEAQDLLKGGAASASGLPGQFIARDVRDARGRVIQRRHELQVLVYEFHRPKSESGRSPSVQLISSGRTPADLHLIRSGIQPHSTGGGQKPLVLGLPKRAFQGKCES
ncbi:hypothetical protein [Paucibacter sp. DJ2R-2]|uniref:hypothetical protein n=1 Tax=Paucibacter sp. DJ2R-2 TaxID=2893558 RepID=UPI0021E3E787|nr:hypothetical protein [Paucibacter sp. DJ2R-2]MCV2441277.1 hypothetical protein [Paucibacter sp. DJ2R-2]